jgi:ribosomal protein S18 acetylase RimI-like enzyme
MKLNQCNAINFISFNDYEKDIAYKLYKEAFLDIISRTFGWNETSQTERFNNYDLNDFKWINICGKNIGYICLVIDENSFHLRLLIIEEQHQRKGYGGRVIQTLENAAFAKNKSIKMSSFKINSRANSLYRRLGYVFADDDEVFYEIIKSAQQARCTGTFEYNNW